MIFLIKTRKYQAPMQINGLLQEFLEMATTNHQKRKCSPMQKPKSYWHILPKRKSQTPCQNIPREILQQFQIRLLPHQTVRDSFQPHSQSNTPQIKGKAATNTNATIRHFVSSLIQINSSCPMLKSHRPMQIPMQFHTKSLVPLNAVHRTTHILNSTPNHRLKCRKHRVRSLQINTTPPHKYSQ